MSEQELFGPIKLSGRALYDDGQIINSNVINHVMASLNPYCLVRADLWWCTQTPPQKGTQTPLYFNAFNLFENMS